MDRTNTPLVVIGALALGLAMGWLLGNVGFGLVLAAGFGISAYLALTLASEAGADDD